MWSISDFFPLIPLWISLLLPKHCVFIRALEHHHAKPLRVLPHLYIYTLVDRRFCFRFRFRRVCVCIKTKERKDTCRGESKPKGEREERDTFFSCKVRRFIIYPRRDGDHHAVAGALARARGTAPTENDDDGQNHRRRGGGRRVV